MKSIHRISDTEIEVDGDVYCLSKLVTPCENEPEKEWEVMSYISKDGVIANKELTGLYASLAGVPIFKEVLDNHYKIHSVKRLSDGEVFVVGETVEHCTQHYLTKIHGFTIPVIKPRGMWFYYETDCDAVRDMDNFNKCKSITIEQIYQHNDSRWYILEDSRIGCLLTKMTESRFHYLPTELDCKRVQAWIKMRNIMWYFQKDWKWEKGGKAYCIVDNAGIIEPMEHTHDGFTDVTYALLETDFKEKSHAEEAIRLMGEDLQYLM